MVAKTEQIIRRDWQRQEFFKHKFPPKGSRMALVLERFAARQRKLHWKGEALLAMLGRDGRVVISRQSETSVTLSIPPQCQAAVRRGQNEIAATGQTVLEDNFNNP